MARPGSVYRMALSIVSDSDALCSDSDIKEDWNGVQRYPLDTKRGRLRRTTDLQLAACLQCKQQSEP